MGLLDKAKERERKIKSKSRSKRAHKSRTKKSPKKPIKSSSRSKSSPSRGLLHRAKHRKEELKYKTSTKFKRELESSKADVTKTKEERLKEKAESSVEVGPLYSTVIDKVFHHVKNVKSMSLKKMMEVFNLSRKQAEYWANVLDEENLLELYYPPVGDAILRLPEKEKHKIKGKSASSKSAERKGKASKSKHAPKSSSKNKRIAAVSVVFVIIMVLAGVYIISPELLSPLTNIFKYILGKISTIFGGII